MKTFTGWEYLLIDVANNFNLDLDKQRFEDRIQWTTANLEQLETLAAGSKWKEKPLYLKAVMAVRDAQKGIPSGHLVGLDAVCSGLQIMSVLSGCEAGATATGLIDPDRRADAYTKCTEIMSKKLGGIEETNRKKVKQAVMTAFYGSQKEPEKAFGKDTPELAAFYESMYELSPGSCELLEELLDSWQSFALAHTWKLPDGFTAHVRVMQQQKEDIEVDELDHHTYRYVHYVNEGCEKDKKNAANVVHSVDGYILRSLLRRCNYDRVQANWVRNQIEDALIERDTTIAADTDFTGLSNAVLYYLEQYRRTSVADIVILAHLDKATISKLDTEYLRSLLRILNSMLEHESFELVTVHDDFKAHPNNLNHLRRHYRDILAELADSDLLADIFNQLLGITGGSYTKSCVNLGDKIRQSNYALC
jgi:hypothetical protein